MMPANFRRGMGEGSWLGIEKARKGKSQKAKQEKRKHEERATCAKMRMVEPQGGTY